MLGTESYVARLARSLDRLGSRLPGLISQGPAGHGVKRAGTTASQSNSTNHGDYQEKRGDLEGKHERRKERDSKGAHVA
jgi:hypothetical protein